jgi:predicted short-subunit dehydrogenase-like oxidoreductase (DUF2520 family)
MIGIRRQRQGILAWMLKTLSIVGAGRVGRVLGRRLRELGWKIVAVSGRTEATARKSVRFIGAGRAVVGISPDLLASHTILITVPDDAIAQVSDELAHIGGEQLRGKVVLHASGALDARVLAAVQACGAHVGSMHPLQTFSGVNSPVLEGRIFAVQGDNKAVRVARNIARALGGIPFSVAGAKKALYHAAGAFAAGHVLALEEMGVRMLMDAGMKRGEAVRALVSLTRQMLENYEKLGAKPAWTGPLSRGDYGVVAEHERALAQFQPAFLETYRVLNRQAARVLCTQPDTMLNELEKISESLPENTKVKRESA